MGKKLVVVEDDPGIRDVLQIILERAGYVVNMFADGNNLLEELGEVPDMFIVDKLLSGVDGLDVCRHLKKDPSTSHVPIILMSASPQVQAMSKNAGIDAFIEKPFSREHFLNVVEKIIGVRS